jgi:16S rRNA (guanine(966)-N(2))-methyltransferase RsmD
MRVITGIARGRKLVAPAGLVTRPMLDAQKEMLFNVLGEKAAARGVYDLFAGSGALGIESLSRGAETATFVERDRRVADCLRRNVEHCGFSGQAQVVLADAFRLDYARLAHDAELVFVDPPFPLFARAPERLARVLDAIIATERVPPGAVETPQFPPGFEVIDRRGAGSSTIFLLAKTHRAPPATL